MTINELLFQQEQRDARWKALADAATEEPWIPHETGGRGNVTQGDGGDLAFPGGDSALMLTADAEFCAAARTAIPALLADLARARAAIRLLTLQRDALLYPDDPPDHRPIGDKLDAALLAILRGET